MNGIWTDNIDNYEDWEDMTAFADHLPSACVTGRADDDEMTDADIERYSAEFERRYNEHLRSIKSSSPRRVGRSTASHYYSEEDGLGNLLPTEEEINRYRRSLMPDPVEVISSMIRPHEDTMAAFFLESQW
jgi:hypothetical protein